MMNCAPAAAVPKAALAARASKVFDVSAGWPTEVRKPLLAPVVTYQVVEDLVEVCDELCKPTGSGYQGRGVHVEGAARRAWEARQVRRNTCLAARRVIKEVFLLVKVRWLVSESR